MSQTTPFEALGGREAVLALAHAFYDAMERDHPELTALHECEAPGRVTAVPREPVDERPVMLVLAGRDPTGGAWCGACSSGARPRC